MSHNGFGITLKPVKNGVNGDPVHSNPKLGAMTQHSSVVEGQPTLKVNKKLQINSGSTEAAGAGTCLVGQIAASLLSSPFKSQRISFTAREKALPA